MEWDDFKMALTLTVFFVSFLMFGLLSVFILGKFWGKIFFLTVGVPLYVLISFMIASGSHGH